MRRLRRPPNPLLSCLALTAALSLAGSSLLAQDEERELGWHDRAEVAFVQTDGNAESSSLGLTNTLEHLWENARFSLLATALRAESGAIRRTAVGTVDDFRVVDESDTELTAENYLLRSRYHRDFREDLFWFVGLSWEQNEFAGFESRSIARAGVGRTWWDAEGGHFITDLGLAFTDQDDLVPDPRTDSSFAGLHLAADYLKRFGADDRATFASVLLLDENLDETEDLRADWLNSIAVSMTDRLSLKVSLQLLFDNLPALEEVPLVDAQGADTGRTVRAELDDLDSSLQVSLVIDF